MELLQASILGPLVFIICLRDLPPLTNTLPECIIITYYTVTLIPSKNFTDFFSVSYLYFI